MEFMFRQRPPIVHAGPHTVESLFDDGLYMINIDTIHYTCDLFYVIVFQDTKLYYCISWVSLQVFVCHASSLSIYFV